MAKRAITTAAAMIATAALSACTINIEAPALNAPTPDASVLARGESASPPTATPTLSTDSDDAKSKKARKDSSADSSGQVEAEFTPETQMTDHFAMTVTRVRADADTIGVKVRTCVLELPDGWEGSVRVSPDPWSFLVGSGGASVRAELDPRFGPVMQEQHLSPGECGTGWLTYDMSNSDAPTGLMYSNSLGEVAYF